MTNKSVEDQISEHPTLESLRRAAERCQACPLWKNATQTVFGEGEPDSEVVLVGEQPGDKEDLAGHPFVGPAGKLLDRALAEAGINRAKVYVTNVVKHFSNIRRGKLRIHKKPKTSEIEACGTWLRAEFALIKPKVIVCLGATAAQALLGRDFRVTRRRGEMMRSEFAPLITATVHPSSILRAPDDESRHEQMREFVGDLKKVAQHLPPTASLAKARPDS